MKKIKIIFIILLMVVMLLTSCNTKTSIDDLTNENTFTEEKVDYISFFEDGLIHEIYIEIDEGDFTEILDNPLDEVYHEASIILDGVEVSTVGLRTKGNSTLRDVASSESNRYSFKIKVNEYEDQKILGLDEFVLNNMYSDASYLREYISYEAMAANGLNVPLSSFVNVYINHELYGFYLLVESVDDSFLNRSFGDNDGNLYRADTGTSLDIVEGDYIENVSQKNGDDESKDDLYELMNILNDMPDNEKGDIESILDVESALRYIAMNTLLENYDSLNGQHLSNYYLYNDQGKFVVIPWDYNMAFGSFGGAGQSTVDIDSPISGTSETPVLIENLLQVKVYKDLYYEILEEYMAYFEDFEDYVIDLADLIRNEVENDPSKFTSMAMFESNVVYQKNGAVEVASMMDSTNKTSPEGRPTEFPLTGEEGSDERPVGPPPAGEKVTNNQALGDRPVNNNNQLQGSDVSLINILLFRIENIQEQLSKK